MTSPDRSPRRLVRDLIHRDSVPSDLARAVAEIDPGWLVQIVTSHRIAGAVQRRLVEGEVLSRAPAYLRDELQAWVDHETLHHLSALRILDNLGEILDVPWYTAKGPVLAGHWYSSPTERAYRDVDIYVARDDFGRAYQALTGSGMTDLNVNFSGFVVSQTAELPLDAGVMSVDLHWHPIVLGREREMISIDADRWVDERIEVDVGARRVPTIDPERTLLHLCLHTGLGLGRYLVWLIDVDRVAGSGRIDWDRFCAAALDSGAGPLVAAVLARAEYWVGTPVPAAVINRLDPSTLRRWVGWTVERVPRRVAQSVESWASGMPMRLAVQDRHSVGPLVAEELRSLLRRRPADHDDRTRDRASGSVEDYLTWVDSGAAVVVR